MNGILALSADLLERGHNLSQADRESVQIIQDCADHLLNLLNDLLEFSSIESGGFKLDHLNFSVPEQIVKVANIFAISARKKNISIGTALHMDRPYRNGTLHALHTPHCQCSTDLMPIGDPVRFCKVLSLLVSNAVKFTPEGGRIVLTATDEGEERESPSFRVEVADSGIGIAPEKIKAILQGFSKMNSSKTNKEGAGIGLALCNKMCQAMGGQLTVSSELSKGSTFCFAVKMPPHEVKEYTKLKKGKDLHLQATCESAGGSREGEESLKGLKILVVEDNVVNQIVARKMLSSFGCKVCFANNGLEAVNLLREMTEAIGDGQAKRWPFFDAVLCDIQMPVLDGY